MGRLTSDQVKQLADDFMLMANAVGDYRFDNKDKLTKEENEQLKEMYSESLSHTTELYTKSALLVMNDVETSLAKIRTITVETQELYKKLVGVQKVLDRATGVLALSSAILSMDLNGITSSIKGLLTSEA